MSFSPIRTSFLLLGIYITMTPASFAEGNATPAQNTPKVLLQNQGNAQGYFENNLAVFKGIPYARPPIKMFRWLPPQPALEWEGTKVTTQFAPMCSQYPNSWDTDPAFKITSEDCLYLNVWAPKAYFDNPDTKRNFPVMVWIHGGAFVSGGSSLKIYDPSAIAQQGVVVVSINYRLGRFGFFAHPALNKESEEDRSGNFGLMDQIAALKWVQNNISVFGGDSTNVTIFGESAGGASIISLMTISEAQGLFDKAIIQSGTGHSKSFPPTPKDKAMRIGTDFAKKHNIIGDDSKALQQLRSLPTEEIVDGLNIQNLQPDYFSGLMIDQTLIKQSLEESNNVGNFYPVPLLIGDTDGDGLVLSKITLEQIAKDLKTNVADINKIYNPDGKNSETKVVHQIVADTQILEPTRVLAQQVSRKDVLVYRYRFSYIAESARPYSSFGAPHASEIPFVFDTLRFVFHSISNQDEAMAKAITASWVNFAKNGDPTVHGFTTFKTVSEAPQQLLNFSMSGIKFERDPFQKRLDFIDNLFKHTP